MKFEICQWDKIQCPICQAQIYQDTNINIVWSKNPSTTLLKKQKQLFLNLNMSNCCFREKAREFVQRQQAGEMSSSNKIVPEIEHLLPTAVHDLGSHTVSVTHIDDLAGLQEVTRTIGYIIVNFNALIFLGNYLGQFYLSEYNFFSKFHL